MVATNRKSAIPLRCGGEGVVASAGGVCDELLSIRGGVAWNCCVALGVHPKVLQ